MQPARTSGLSEADHCDTASSGCWVSSPAPSWLRPVHSTVPLGIDQHRAERPVTGLEGLVGQRHARP